MLKKVAKTNTTTGVNNMATGRRLMTDLLSGISVRDIERTYRDTDKLKKFFDYNDLLDQSRNVKLIDYIPELEACRSYITKPI